MSDRRAIFTLVIALAWIGALSLLGQVKGSQQATYRVSGKLFGGPPILASRFGQSLILSLRLRPRGDDAHPAKPLILRGTLNADGSFEVSNVPPGTYVLTVYPAGASLQSVPTILVTNRDVTGLEIPLVRTEVVTSSRNLQIAWSLSGYWSGIAASKDGTYAASPGIDAATTPVFAMATMPGHIREIDYNGTVRREIPIPPFRAMRLAVAHFSGSSNPVFLMYGQFVNEGPQPLDVHAFDDKGNLLWAHPSLEGPSDVAVLDLGNGLDRVVIGYVTRGLRVLNGEGKLLWESTTIPNVYSVAAGHVRAEEKTQVVSAAGLVHIFNGEGENIAGLDPKTPARMVRVGKLSERDRTATIFAIGAKPADSSVTVSSLSGVGKINWSIGLPSKITPVSIYSVALAPGKPWLAVGMGDGQIFVVDVRNGTIVASIDGQSQLPEIAWVAGQQGVAPRLVVSTTTALHAYTVTAK